MKKKITKIFFLILLLIISNIPAYAGGPLVVKNGNPVEFKTAVKYRFDQGSLGSLSNTEAVTLIEDLLDDWGALSNVNITFQADSPSTLSVDVTSSNHSTYTGNAVLGYTPIIFDIDGSLTNALIPGGKNIVLGFAGPKIPSSGPQSGDIIEALAVFNGRFIDGVDNATNPEVSINAFRGTVIHELGHAIGLDHSQINKEALTSNNQTVLDSVPLMFPISVNDLYSIKLDDNAAAASLYPKAAQISNYGTIAGKVFRSNGTTPVQGANVIARRVGGNLDDAVSCVSDYLSKNTGEYKFFALPPGDYKIEIEPIEAGFYGGSSVGPFAESASGKSFISPVPSGYYTGAGLTISSDSNNAATVTVSAGQNITGQDIIASFTTSSTSSTSSCGGEIAETEPNDLIAEAQLLDCLPVTITGTANSSDTGEIELMSGDGSTLIISDVFQFTISDPGIFNATLLLNSTSASDDLDLVLLDESANTIIASSSNTNNDNESISQTLEPGTYLVGVGAFSGSSDYSLDLSFIADGGDPAVEILPVNNKNSILLTPDGKPKSIFIKAKSYNFTGKTSCTASYTLDGAAGSDENIVLKLKPTTFSLSKKNNPKAGHRRNRRIKIQVPGPKGGDVSNYIQQNYTEAITGDITVNCGNGTSDTYSIDIIPNIDSLRVFKDFKYVTRKR